MSRAVSMNWLKPPRVSVKSIRQQIAHRPAQQENAGSPLYLLDGSIDPNRSRYCASTRFRSISAFVALADAYDRAGAVPGRRKLWLDGANAPETRRSGAFLITIAQTN